MTAMPKRIGDGIELLADPTRRRIVAAVAIRPRRPSSLATELGLSRPAIARQLGLLFDAGLVDRCGTLVDGRVILYRVSADRHGQITAWLAGTEIGRRTDRTSTTAVDAGGGITEPSP